VQGPRVPGQFKKNNFSVTVKIRTSGYKTPECFIATLPTWGEYGRLVHAGENFNSATQAPGRYKGRGGSP